MKELTLRYGTSGIDVTFDPHQFDVLGTENARRNSLTDAGVGAAFDAPIDSALLEDLVEPGDSVLLVVPDATRRTGSGQIVNLLVRRLIANGSSPSDISIIFATGIHRPVTDEEKAGILTPFIAQRIKMLDHDPRDLARLVRVGETAGGIKVELDRALVERDHVVIVGGANFHYFAGFTGGRKLICPGLASSHTVSATHKLAFDCSTHSRRRGVDTALLDGNPVNEAFMECVAMVPPTFAVTALCNDDGSITDVFCGDWVTSHRAACEEYATRNTISITEQRPVVVASCGGWPHDINIIQAHKTLDAASRACTEGGTIFLIAECRDGTGRADFMDWFGCANSRALASRLCERYQVNGQTAWNLLRIAETHDVRIVTSLDSEVVSSMRLRKSTPADISIILGRKDARGYIVPAGARNHIRVETT